MVVTVLHRMAGEPAAGTAAADLPAFVDVRSGAWYADAVFWAAGNGIVEGYGAGRFGPNEMITRQDLAVVLARYAEFAGMEMPAVRAFEEFNDAHMIAGHAVEAVRGAFVAGIVNGRGNGMFDPTARATRAEFAAMLQRLST